jgi:hypothetical protein
MKNFKQQALSFLRTVQHSLTDIRFYRGIRHKRPGEAAGYLAILVSIAWCVPFLAVFFVSARGALGGFIDGFDRHVPVGTVFTLKNGVFTDTLTAPILVTTEGMRVVVNTATGTVGLHDKEMGIVVMQDRVIEQTGDGQSQTVSFAKLPDFSGSKEDLLDRFRASAPWIIGALALFGLAAFTLAAFASIAIMTITYGLALWLVLRVLKKPLSYKEAWTLAAYAITPAVLARAILAFVPMDLGWLPGALYLALLGFIAFDLWKGTAADQT